ncbi:FecR family protein [Sphingobacterium paucimobilis]|uniref:FecR protein domain-containing protein n=1 Tax=Sphingobacterium paucimobilis HER1398 TaxID=1346330 RepID=U2HDQ1_9SPHI|nr:FecR family protein [Sphingobacterium paucimobilis]ERJ59896.1 hypothetical protein M472_14080 [Sphingobacterium paucimobilis HER1398]
MKRKPLLHYIKNVLRNENTPEEEDIVNQHFFEAFDSQEWDETRLGNKEERKSNILAGVESKMGARKTINFKVVVRYAAAVAIVGFLGFWGWSFFDNKEQISLPKDVLTPGGDVAVLELGDGTRFDLTGLTEGEAYEKSGVIISRNAEGELEYAYQAMDEEQATAEWNTLTTPMGGKYSIVLADGTKAWLNAGSTLTFPSAFQNGKRIVKAQGEVYFEVSKDENKPFIVQAKGFDIQVLGTSFNLSAYDDIASVALIEGSVEIKTPSVNSKIKPGQKAKIHPGDIAISPFDIETEIAWKDNYFIFKDRNIKEIMASLARWYNAEIDYVGRDWEDKNYTIRMSRNQDIKDVLSIIELTKSVKFKIEERRITVYNIAK